MILMRDQDYAPLPPQAADMAAEVAAGPTEVDRRRRIRLARVFPTKRPADNNVHNTVVINNVTNTGRL